MIIKKTTKVAAKGNNMPAIANQGESLPLFSRLSLLVQGKVEDKNGSSHACLIVKNLDSKVGAEYTPPDYATTNAQGLYFITCKQTTDYREEDMTWGWKLVTCVDYEFAFLNGTAPYQTPVSTARICAMWKGNHPEFYVFYQNANQFEGGWGWKLATEPDDVQCFMCGSGSYKHRVKEAQS